MARGRSPQGPQGPALPTVSFEKVEDDTSTPPSGVHDHQARSYGYNDFSEFQRPTHYIRHIEPLEMDLARQVEYDMDEQDKEWLDSLNAERKKDQVDKISYELFEIVMDRLEKEWFDLTKNIPKPDFAMPSEDSTCAICDDSEGENSNAIVFCDGCNLAVHQDCYGVPYIPEGQWLCRKCTVSPENPVSCVLCPNEGGAFKQTVTGDWVHLLCAIWIPETRVANDVFMEPVTGVDKISKQRWKLKCSVCDIREGACIQCAKTSCFLAFHPTCARKEKLLLPMKSAQGAEPLALTCYCERHLPKEQADAREKALANEDAYDEYSNKSTKSARAYAKSYKPGPPLIPAIIVDRISQYVAKVSVRKKMDFLHMMCRYWSLKREARRGAPLLKRLHLEPWTASTNAKLQTEEDRTLKLEQLRRLREDLEKAKQLVDLIRKRELKKRQQAEVLQDVLSQCLFPHEPPLRLAFERIMSFDRNDYFKNPVNKAEVPDYFDVVKKPMCWTVIDGKLDRHQYWDVEEFKSDVQLVTDNALLYNKAGTPYHKAALRIQSSSQPILLELDSLAFKHFDVPLNGEHVDGEAFTPNLSDLQSLPSIGDLEPPLNLLELICSPNEIKDDLNFILEDDPIESLFKFELEREKPPPPPPPPRPRKASKAKHDRSEYNARRREQRAAAKAEREAAARAAAELEGEGQRTMHTTTVETSQAFVDEQTPSTSSIVASRTSRPKPEPLPSHPELLDSVDNKGSFKYFHAGWILPADTRRGGRAPPTIGFPPPKKRARTGTSERAASALSMFSTAEDENQTLRSGSQGVDQAPNMEIGPSGATQPEEPPQPMEIDQTMGIPAEPAPSVDPTVIPPGHIIHNPDGTIIIEELDTPAIRREKNNRRKAERARLLAEAEFEPSPPSEAGSEADKDAPQERPRRERKQTAKAKESTSYGRGRKSVYTPTAPITSVPSEPGLVELNGGKTLESGTLGMSIFTVPPRVQKLMNLSL
ncbi:bromodomain and phd finger-containing protein 3 [Moniliophthora roreri MCA 2997]|uniref:Bromodomain and phd finger-containing protein 3 n=1 Tax=Moniliophthora roreri (strain MCA 2997) TaxID=1381753 RepID=V2XV52_MONRO|nr:bromodomain and phd finger-containing protein 3 [Moniliophthora roreri MCA 2997]